MTARLLIETSTYTSMEDWIFRLDEHEIIDGDSFDLALRGGRYGTGGKPGELFTLMLSAPTAGELAAQIKLFRSVGTARTASASDDMNAFDVSSPEEVNWPGLLKAFAELFRRGLHRALTRGAKPFFSREFVSAKLEELARMPDTDHELRAAIYSTLAKLEKGAGKSKGAR